MPNQYTPLRERFDSGYVPEPMSGCWLWVKAASACNRAGTDLRPIINVNGKSVRAYRVSYELHRGPIPEGRFVCHKCDTPLCVNPDHLYLGDVRTNARDAVERRRLWAHRHPVEIQERARRLGQRNTWSRQRPHKSIIPHADVPQMLERRAAGETLQVIAERYGVSRQAVRTFLRRAVARAAIQLADPPRAQEG